MNFLANNAQMLWTISIAFVLIIIAIIDMRTMTIPDSTIIVLLVIAIAHIALYKEVAIASRLMGMLIVSVPMCLLCLIVSEAFGGGDIKLIAVAGIILGAPKIILAFLIAVILGGAAGVYLLITKKAKVKNHFAFGPYICIGIIIAYIWGDIIIKSWLKAL